MKHLKITSAELAQICGVSQGTVDRALNNRTGIKEETKQKILQTAKLYGYREYVENCGTVEAAGQIGFIVFNLNNEYFSKLLMETEKILKKINCYTVVMMTHYDRQQEIECIRNMYNGGVKGIILCPVNSGKAFENYLNMFDIPIVTVGNHIQGVPYVGIDDFAAMKDMTEWVITQGYDDLVYFSPALQYPRAFAQRMRYQGFSKAAKNVRYTVKTDMKELAETYENKTAIICSADYYAFLVRTKIKNLGNVKITGFDNLDAIEKYQMGIDSVGYSMSKIAGEAIRMILSRRKTGNIIVDHKIVEHSRSL